MSSSTRAALDDTVAATAATADPLYHRRQHIKQKRRHRAAARPLGPGRLTAATALLLVAATTHRLQNHHRCGPCHVEALRPLAGRAAGCRPGRCYSSSHPALIVPAGTGQRGRVPPPLRYKSLLDDEGEVDAGVDLEEPPASVPKRRRWRRGNKREEGAASAGGEEDGDDGDAAEAPPLLTTPTDLALGHGTEVGHHAEEARFEEVAHVAATNETMMMRTTPHASPVSDASVSRGRLRGAVLRGVRRLPRLSRLILSRGAKNATTVDATDVVGEGTGRDARKKRKKKEKEPAAIVRDVHELREAVLVRGIPLKDLDVRPYGDDVEEIVDDNGDTGEDGEVVGGSVNGQAEPVSAVPEETNREEEAILDHEVLRLIAHRVATKSTPGNRHKNDVAHLALAIEGGGMRGAVSAGMAAAVASLGLSDAFDSIYGSSAGSVVGAYMVSRQMCVDVYTEVLPAAKRAFVCKNRILGGLVLTLLQEVAGKVPLRAGSAAVMDKLTSILSRGGGNLTDDDAIDGIIRGNVTSATDARSRLLSSITSRMPSMSYWSSSSTPSNGTDSVADYNVTSGDGEEDAETTSTRRRLLPLLMSRLPSSLSNYLTNPLEIGPGMNISFVLDGILSSETGLRPFDFDAFRRNDLRQPLKVVASSVRGDVLETVAFGSRDGDFFPPSFYDGLDLDDLRKSSAKDTDEEEDLKGYRFTRVGKRMLRKAARKSSVVIRGAAQKSAAVVRGVARRTPRPKLKRKRLMDTFGRINPYMNSTSAAATILGGGEERHGKWEKGANMTNTTSTFPSDAEGRHHEWRVTSCPDDSTKDGFFGCLECSMLVPGAAGPPVRLLRSKYQEPNQSSIDTKEATMDDNNVTNASATQVENNVNVCFDAFSYEAIPYRSAVYGGNATHVLCLRSRPDGAELETKPGVYERVVAPLYFRSNNLPTVAEYFVNGGQQYRYVEDIMTLDEGLEAGCRRARGGGGDGGGSGGGSMEDGGDEDKDVLGEGGEVQSDFRRNGVKVPPTDVLYGLEGLRDTTASDDADITESWKRAHLLPLMVPKGTPELPTLTQDKEEVVRAVRNGYAAAFDALAPVAGLDVGDDRRLDGHRVAELMFPIRGEGGGGSAGDEDYDVDAAILGTPVEVKGDAITEHEREKKRDKVRAWVAAKKRELLEKRTLPWGSRSSTTDPSTVPYSSSTTTTSSPPLSTDVAHGGGDSTISSAAGPVIPSVAGKGKRSWASLLSKRLFGVVPITDDTREEIGDALSQEVEMISAMAAAEASLLGDPDELEAQTLLASLPGFRSGKLTHLAGGLRSNETMYNV